jgi:DNA repair protein RadA/Sms
LGEVGLNGELRGVSHVERRIAEAIRLGFKSCLMPRLPPIIASEVKHSFHSADIHLIEVSSVTEALRWGLTRERKMQNTKGENTGQE